MSRPQYGREHRTTRAAWTPLVRRGGVICARYEEDPLCPGEIDPGDEWHLDHQDNRRDYRGPAHAACNERAAGKRSAAKRAAPRPRSRRW